MYIAYDDITSRIGDEPIWWQFGVPRYVPFQPKIATIYSNELALVRTRCQACHRPFDVLAGRTDISIRDQLVLQGQLSVGDPPSHDNSCGGSMMSEQLAILECWESIDVLKWRRVPDLEGPLGDADDPTDAPKSLIQKLHLAGLMDRYDALHDDRREGVLAEILAAAGIERPDYYARLLSARSRAEELKVLARKELAFTLE